MLACIFVIIMMIIWYKKSPEEVIKSLAMRPGWRISGSLVYFAFGIVTFSMISFILAIKDLL